MDSASLNLRRNRLFLLSALVGALLLDPSAPARAAEAVVDRSAIVKALAPVRFLPEHSQRGAQIDLDVAFALGSAALTTNAKRQLDELAAALRGPELAEARFVLAGHTDARGPEDVNLRLSRARAQAVRTYLVTTHRLAAARIEADGFGESRLKRPLDPNAAANRRVEVIAFPRRSVPQSSRRAVTE
ncbi:MAG: OmpA family protein [Alphaproteobacteria bacterium]|nr:OmpA family protein [Alphaproteobacteria bacterium]